MESSEGEQAGKNDGSKGKSGESRGRRDESVAGRPTACTSSKICEAPKKKTKYAQKYHKEWEFAARI